jgi:hypothetical protein
MFEDRILRKIFLGIYVVSMVSCVGNSQSEMKAETAVKNYLDSLYHNSRSYQIIEFKGLRPAYTKLEDDPSYNKYKKVPSKLDSVEKRFSPKVRGWSIFVKFKGKNMYGKVGKHIYLCAIDKTLSKCIVAIEVDNVRL